MSATPTLQSGSVALRDAVLQADTGARFAAIGPEAIAGVAQHLPLSADLLAWYATAAPLDVSLPFFPEGPILYDPRELLAWQEGYRWRTGQRETIADDWDAAWLVVGDYGSDPIIARTDLAGTPIAMAAHGRGHWAPFFVAPSLAAYLHALAVWVGVRMRDFGDAIVGDDALIRPDYLAALDERLTPILAEEYRRHWLLLDAMAY